MSNLGFNFATSASSSNTTTPGNSSSEVRQPGAFSFGNSSAEVRSTSGFSFGSPPANANPAGAFSFGRPTDVKSPGAFSFGGTSSNNSSRVSFEPSPAEVRSPGAFSFGGTSSNNSSGYVAHAPASGFSFGGTSSSNGSGYVVPAPASTFSFGTSSQKPQPTSSVASDSVAWVWGSRTDFNAPPHAEVRQPGAFSFGSSSSLTFVDIIDKIPSIDSVPTRSIITNVFGIKSIEELAKLLLSSGAMKSVEIVNKSIKVFYYEIRNFKFYETGKRLHSTMFGDITAQLSHSTSQIDEFLVLKSEKRVTNLSDCDSLIDIVHRFRIPYISISANVSHVSFGKPSNVKTVKINKPRLEAILGRAVSDQVINIGMIDEHTKLDALKHIIHDEPASDRIVWSEISDLIDLIRNNCT